MSKLQRKSAKLFAEDATAAAGGLAQFGSLAAGTPNYSTDPDVIQALDAYKEGWSSAVLGTKSPALEDRNALDYLLSYQQAYIMQRGIPEYLDTETYYIGSVVSNSSQIYISLTDNNTGNALTNTTYWRKFYTPTEIDAFLANKADIDLGNVNTAGKAEAVSWGRQYTDVQNVVAQGGAGIAGTYTLGFTDNKVKIGFFVCSLITTQNGSSSMSIATDIVTTATDVATTNNSHGTIDLITIPFINSITIGFPKTGGGIGTGTNVKFAGWM